MNLLLNCPEIIELDLSNNKMRNLPAEISFLTSLTKLDIRNNNFSNVKIILFLLFIYLYIYSLKILSKF